MSRTKVAVPLLTLGYGLSAFANFLLSVVTGRRLGPAALGDFALAVAMSRIFYSATDLGLAAHLTRILARNRGAAQHFTSLFATFRILLLPAAVLVVAVEGVQHASVVPFAAIALALGMVSLQQIFESLLLSHDRQTDVAALTIFTSIVVSTASIVWFEAGTSLLGFSVGYALATATSVAAWALWTRRRLEVWPRMAINFPELRAELGRSWPIGASSLLGIAALRAPVLALGWFGSAADVGAFSAVDMFVTAAAILQAAVTSATFPKLAATFRKDPARFRQVFWLSNVLLACVGVAIATSLALFGVPLIHAVFHAKSFGTTSELVRVIAWSTPCLLLVHHNIMIFAASDRERSNVRLMAVWFAIIALFQITLIPAFGLRGAAWGVLLGRLVGLVALCVAIAAARLHRGTDADVAT